MLPHLTDEQTGAQAGGVTGHSPELASHQRLSLNPATLASAPGPRRTNGEAAKLLPVRGGTQFRPCRPHRGSRLVFVFIRHLKKFKDSFRLSEAQTQVWEVATRLRRFLN